MTKQACAEFFAKINNDAALQQDFLKAIEGKEDESMLMDAARSMVEVGTKYGYDFTNEEVAQTYKEIKEKAAMEGEGGELEEEALEMVAGGGGEGFTDFNNQENNNFQVRELYTKEKETF